MRSATFALALLAVACVELRRAPAEAEAEPVDPVVIDEPTTPPEDEGEPPPSTKPKSKTSTADEDAGLAQGETDAGSVSTTDAGQQHTFSNADRICDAHCRWEALCDGGNFPLHMCLIRCGGRWNKQAPALSTQFVESVEGCFVGLECNKSAELCLGG